MGASLTVGTDGLRRLAASFLSPALRAQAMRLPQEKAIAALVGQAVADNFAQQGPGWAPLQPKTIRTSVARKLRKSLSSVTDEELLEHERLSRRKSSQEAPHRMILQRSNLLMKTATTPNYRGAKGGNIWKTEGTNLIWGTDLVYAAVHNYGFPKRNIPKREFLRIREEWMRRIEAYIVVRFETLLRQEFQVAT